MDKGIHYSVLFFFFNSFGHTSGLLVGSYFHPPGIEALTPAVEAQNPGLPDSLDSLF